MYLSSTRTDELWPDTLKGALRAIAIASVFLALAATLLYVLSPGLDTWPRLLVFHESVAFRRGLPIARQQFFGCQSWQMRQTSQTCPVSAHDGRAMS